MDKQRLNSLRKPYIVFMVILGFLVFTTSRMAISMAKTGAGNPLEIKSSEEFSKLWYSRCVYFENKEILPTGWFQAFYFNGAQSNAPATDFALARLDDGSYMIITLNAFIPLDYNAIPDNWAASSYGYVMEPMGVHAEAIDGLVNDFSVYNGISVDEARAALHADYFVNTIRQRPKKLLAPTLTVTIVLSVLFLLCAVFCINPKLTRAYWKLMAAEKTNSVI